MDKVKKPAVVETTEYEVPEIGAVVYFLKPTQIGNCKYGLLKADVGIVADVLGSEVCIQRLEINTHKKVNGTPIEEIDFPTRWEKLPNGWTPSTNLAIVEEDSEASVDIKDPEKVFEAYLKGDLVNAGNAFNGDLDVAIHPEYGYQLYFDRKQLVNTTVLSVSEIYKTYSEALTAEEDYMNSLRKQAEMSEKEFSLYNIKKLVEKRLGAKIGRTVRDKLTNNYMTFFENLDSVEKVEAKIEGSCVAWRYKDKKRWNKIDPDEIEVV